MAIVCSIFLNEIILTEMQGTAKLYKYHTTNLGYAQLQDVGAFYRNRYIKKNADHQILGISPDQYKESQLWVTAPDQTVSHPLLELASCHP